MDAVVSRVTKRSRNFLGFGCLVISVVQVIATADPSSSNTARIIGLVRAVIGVVGAILLASMLAALVLRPFVLRPFVLRPFVLRPFVLRRACAAPVRARRARGAPVRAAPARAVLRAFGTGRLAWPPQCGGRSAAHRWHGDRDHRRHGPGGETARRISAIEPAALGTVLTPKITAGS
ncbi:hypothetical protein [Saccharopolyspora spinosa]|uniref:Uncharacterized protein n=1 Tax=Saccharopolyspora spinosa TaxID=60894 RepID=A0A2N3XSW4_SACSN|nr:hypothetical protein [Saccharopolyspora spinosa]PKW13763.1 hypothetical protein A8926_1319 [Saccharopolyspora spinosa]